MRASLVLLGLTCLVSSCAIPYKKYGLMTVMPVTGPDRAKLRIRKEAATKLEGSSCTRIITLIPISFGLFEMEEAIRKPISELKRPEIVGMADVEIDETLLFIPPFYTSICWRARGFAAVAGK